MREIKFRVWDKDERKMRTSAESGGIDLYINLAGNLSYTTYDDFLRDLPNNVLMQFTGLKDKNGKEIYEGDIVDEFRKSRSFPEGRHLKRVIEWNNDMTLDDSYGCTAVGFNMFGGELEVIGNIYENPELLKA